MTPASTAGVGTSNTAPDWVEAANVKVFPCEEHGPVDIPLEEILDITGHIRLNPEIEKGDYFAVSLKAGKLTLRARSYVGYIPLNDHILVYVRPRVPIQNLTRIVAFSGLPPTPLSTIRQYGTDVEWNDSLVDLYAVALVTGVERALSSGLLHDYERREETSSFPRGRVLIHRTIQQQWSRNIRHAAQVAWFERTVDNACNQCLKYALLTVAQGYITSPPSDRPGRILQRRVNALASAFSLVTLDSGRQFLADPLVRGLRQLPAVRFYYREVLDVALAIIERRGVLLESTDGNLRLPSLVLDMDSVFERYIRRALALYAIQRNWPVKVMDGNRYPAAKILFNERPSPEVTPDIIIRRLSGETPLVCEIKSIPIKGKAIFSDRDSINQVVTYAVSYSANQALLIHPCATVGQPSGIRKLGDIQGIRVYQYRFNLGADDLDAERRDFGQAVSSLITEQ